MGTTNSDHPEWLALMTDLFLAQSAVVRLKSAAYELVVEGEAAETANDQPCPTRPPDAARSRGHMTARG